jgi:hypothetical protein
MHGPFPSVFTLVFGLPHRANARAPPPQALVLGNIGKWLFEP